MCVSSGGTALQTLIPWLWNRLHTFGKCSDQRNKEKAEEQIYDISMDEDVIELYSTGEQKDLLQL